MRRAASSIPINIAECAGRMSKKEKLQVMLSIEEQMKEAAKNLDFERATELRDILFEMRSND